MSLGKGYVDAGGRDDGRSVAGSVEGFDGLNPQISGLGAAGEVPKLRYVS